MHQIIVFCVDPQAIAAIGVSIWEDSVTVHACQSMTQVQILIYTQEDLVIAKAKSAIQQGDIYILERSL